MNRFLFCASIAAASLLAAPAAAITEIYTDKARFLSLVSGDGVSEPYPGVQSGLETHVSGPLTFSTPGAETLFFDEWTATFPGSELAITGLENLNVDIAFATSSIGFDFEDPTGGDTVFSITLLRDGITVYSGQVTTNTATRFVGVWSDTPFTKLEIRDSNSTGQDEYFGEFYTGDFPNRDRSSNTTALLCQLPLLFSHNFSLSASFFAPTPTDIGFGWAAFSSNLALKLCPAWGTAPPDIITYPDNLSDPDSEGACFKTFKQERVQSLFTNVLGVPVRYDYDWGELGTPSVIHQNSDVEVYQLLGKVPPNVDGPGVPAFLSDESASRAIYAGCDDIRELSDNGYVCPFSAGRELKFGVGRGSVTYRFATLMGLLDFLYLPIPKFFHGAKNEETKQFMLELLLEVSQIVVSNVFLDGWRFGNHVDRNQAVVVYDLHAPTITKATGDFNDDGVVDAADQAFIDEVVIEADEIGGVSASRFRNFLRSMYERNDACDRPVTFGTTYPTDELRVFWPVCTTCNDSDPNNDNSFEITWVASDPGPNENGLPNSTTRTQEIRVVDTRPPVMQPPMDIVEVTSETSVTLDLGQPLVFDLVDLNPTITNDAVFPMSPGLHMVTWTATDASGNAESVTQSVNIKNSNIEPTADALAGANRQQAVSFEPTELRLTGFDADNDPLNFFIEDYPPDGFFIAPLYPFFIEDYRLEATIDDDDVQALICDVRPPGSDFVHMPVIRAPFYFSVLDDGTTYVMDNGYVQCQESLNKDPSFGVRIAVFDATGQFIAGQDRSSTPDDLYIDTRTDLVYTTTGQLSNGLVNVLDADLNTIQTYNLFSLRDADNVSHSISGAKSAVLDSQGVIYIVTNNDSNNPGEVHAVRAEMDPGNSSIRPEYLGKVLSTTNQGVNFDMAIDTKDNLYVSMGNRIYKISAATTDENGDIELGSLVGWLGKCTADLAPGDQAVCDVTNQRSLGYACTDETCSGAGASGNQPGQFADPRGIAIDPNDVLYVTDYQNFRVQRFTPEGFFAGQAESACDGNCFVLGDFGRPRDIAVNSSHFFILDPDTELLHISQTSPFLEIGAEYATLLYSSNNDFACVDSTDCIDTFTFSVSDGVRDSDTGQMIRSTPALVQVEVERNFRPPFATPGIDVTTPEEQATAITLDGSDPDQLDSLTFNITRPPSNGSLTVVDNQATYTSSIDYVGEDSFDFTVSDGQVTSAPETISITVTDVNDPAVVDFESSPVTVGRGFETRFEGSLHDPDPVDQHSLLVKWNDGTPDEPEGEITMMGDVTGPLLLQNPTGSGTIRASHTFDTAGNYQVEFCVTDRIDDSSGSKQPTAESLTQCSPQVVDVQDMVDVTLEFTGPDALVRGQSSDYFVTLTNQTPDSGGGLAATGLELVAEIDPLLTTVAPAGCSRINNRISCTLDDLAPGASTSLTIPIIVPGDPGDIAQVQSEVNLTLNELDTKGVNKLLVTTPLVFDADFIIGGVAEGELEDDADGSLGDGVCEGSNNAGVCNLRAAVMEANAFAGPQTIALGNQVFTLTQEAALSPHSGSGDLDVEEDLTIIGNGPEHTYINAAGIDRIFEVWDGTTLTLDGLTLSGGLADQTNGGAIRVSFGGRLVLRNVRITGNTTTNSGGAIYSRSELADSLLIEDSAISGNTAVDGAGIFHRGGGELINVTISANRAGDAGGGVYSFNGDLVLTNVTIADNSAASGGGISQEGGDLRLRNTLVASNSAETGPDCHTVSGPLATDGGNLIEDPTDCSVGSEDNQLDVAAGITELADNGGPTRTYALSANSAARDHGLSNFCPATDQRGQPRPTDGIGNGQPACDVGAFEAGMVGFMPVIFSDSFE